MTSPTFKGTFEPLVPLIASEFGVHRSSAYRSAGLFGEHAIRVLGRKLPQTEKQRVLMVDREL
ncbi:hypothetical protein [Deinococcus hohokamensis]|uniref:Transposase n=1 Tax=Deinococcus hohokamensis TaxID=309883 RepID=A0ABV9I600_9DEIO